MFTKWIRPYVKAYCFNSSNAWCQLAKKNPNKYLSIAKKVINVKQSHNEIQLIFNPNDRHLQEKQKHYTGNLRELNKLDNTPTVFINSEHNIDISNMSSLNRLKLQLMAKVGTVEFPMGVFNEMKKQSSLYSDNVIGARYGKIPTMRETQYILPDGIHLPANYIKISDRNVAIATQFPLETHLENHFKMLLDNQTPVLVVLASDEDLVNKKAPDYLSNGEIKNYGDLIVQSKEIGAVNIEEHPDLIVKKYDLSIKSSSGEEITIPVIRVTNWPDCSGLEPGVLKALALKVRETKENKIKAYKEKNGSAFGDENKLLPVYHCLAGVGRTGQLIAAGELLTPDGPSLETIVTDMRYSRNNLMVQTSEQLDLLAELADSEGRMILNGTRSL